MKHFLRVMVTVLLAVFVMTGCVTKTTPTATNASGEATQTPAVTESSKPSGTVKATATPRASTFTVDPKVFEAPEVTAYDEMNYSPEIKGIFYKGLDYNGKATRVFAYIGMPKNASPSHKVPAVVLVHGGGGTAFADWVKMWVDRGYAAIAMDNYGNIPVSPGATTSKHDDVAGGCPPNSSFSSYRNFLEYQWMYHAVSEAILANSLLRANPNVDSSKIGISGISWGGHIASLTIGKDDRFAFGIPVYGCGFLHESYASFAPMMTNPLVSRLWDASMYFENVKFPVLWINSDHDAFYSVDATSKSANATGGELSIQPDLQHGHKFDIMESYRFADKICKGGGGLVDITQHPSANTGRNVSFKFTTPSDLTVTKAYVLYSTTPITYSKDYTLTSTWVKQEATLDTATGTVTYTLPTDAKLYYGVVMSKDTDTFYTVSTKLVELN